MRFRNLLGALLLALGSVMVVAPAANAATGFTTIYQDADYVNPMAQFSMPLTCSQGGVGDHVYQWSLGSAWSSRISGFRVFPGTSAGNCNWAAVRQAGPAHTWYSQCISAAQGSGMMRFGPGWNDSTDAITVGFYAGCARFQ